MLKRIIIYISILSICPAWAMAYETSRAGSDTIIVASEPDYPPFCIVDKNGKAAGFSVDLFKAAAREAGLHVEMKIGIWDQIKDDLKEGHIDALPLVGRTPERENIFDFTMPYISLHGAVFVRDGTNNIHTISDLKDKIIVVMRGDNAEEYVRRDHLSDSIVTTNTFEEAFRLLSGGKYDVVVTQKILGLNLCKNLELENIHTLDIPLSRFRQDFCFAVKEGDSVLLDKLNEGLSVVIANDTYQKTKLKWLGPDTQDVLTWRTIYRRLIIILGPLLVGFALFFIFFLRNEVNRKTLSLNEEIKGHKITLAQLETKQKLLTESEAQIRLLLNSTAEGIYRIDLLGNCTMINNAAMRLLGFADDDQVLGKNMHNLIHYQAPDGDPIDEKDCNIHKAFIHGIGIHREDEVFWDTKGKSIPVEYFSHPIVSQGKVTGAVVTFWDITQRLKARDQLINLKNNLEKTVEERTTELNEKVTKLDRSQKAMLYMVEDLNTITAQLKNERRKLEISNKELEAFTYSVSHDLRAPLRAINGFARFLVEDYSPLLDAEGKRYLDTIRRNATKMDKLIIDLLNLSRVSRTEMRLVEVDMKSIVRSVYFEQADENQQKAFEFIVENLPAAKVDVTLIKQVWQNLISNALKYSSKSGIKKIIISGNESEGKRIFTIRDFGAGFNPRYADKLFGIFQRLHKESEFEGTGVGLAIVRRIIERHGGSVSAKSKINNGAEFCFSLPVD